jgi:hypothetical protein
MRTLAAVYQSAIRLAETARGAARLAALADTLEATARRRHATGGEEPANAPCAAEPHAPQRRRIGFTASRLPDGG